MTDFTNLKMIEKIFKKVSQHIAQSSYILSETLQSV